MKSLLLCLGLFVAAPVASAHDHGPGDIELRFANNTIHAHCQWTKGPQSPAESVLAIQWMNAVKHIPMDVPKFAVELWMPEMGHGSAPTQIQREIDKAGNPVAGLYSVSNIYFVMGGKWQVKVTLTYPDGSKETQIIDLDVSGGGHHHH